MDGEKEPGPTERFYFARDELARARAALEEAKLEVACAQHLVNYWEHLALRTFVDEDVQLPVAQSVAEKK